MSEAEFIADQLHRAFYGEAWHGPALTELLEDVDAPAAAAHPIENVHSMWELTLHVAVWDHAALVRLSGKECQPEGTDNFPPVDESNESAWRRAIAEAKATHDKLVKTVAGLPESRLRDRVPGKPYDFAHMLHGIAQHELYHAGQIAILKKACAAPRTREPR
jgi:uncharacterized damage-inducible protein DinB